MTTLPDSIELAGADASPTRRTIVLRELRRLAPSSMPTEALRSLIDEKLGELGSSVLAINDVALHLRHIRNIVVPVNRLPFEVLAQVLSWSRFTSQAEYDFVAATHVCRWWRNVALDHPLLWTTLTVTTLDKAATFLERAQDNLLSVIIHDGTLLRPFVPTLEGLLPRLLSVVVEVAGAHNIVPLVGTLDISTADHLEVLHVVGRWDDVDEHSEPAMFNRGGDNGGGIVDWFLKRQGIAAGAPSLRSLRLSPLFPLWDSPIFRNLSVLELGGPVLLPPGLSGAALLRILRRCPTLERLLLQLVSFGSAADEPEPHWRVTLPLLSQITLRHYSHEVVAGLLSRLILPKTTRFEIVGNARNVVFDWEPSATCLAEFKDFRMVEFLAGLPGATDILSYFFSPSLRDDALPVMTLCMPDTLKCGERGIRLGIPESVDVLKFRRGPNCAALGEVDWIPILRSTVYLRALHVSNPGEALAPIVTALGPLAVNDALVPYDDSPGAGWPCQELETLEVVGVSFSEEVEELLIGLLRDRAAVGLAIRTVQFARPDGPSSAFLGGITKMGVTVHVADSPPKWFADTETFSLDF